MHRLNRRLGQADEARDRLGVAPAFEIVMIGADEVREACRFVKPLCGAHDERDALDVVCQRCGIRQVVHRVGAQHEQGANFAAREFRPQLGERHVAAGALIRRTRQIDRRAVRANRLVDEVAQNLDAHVLASRNDETAAARGPETIGDRRRAPKTPAMASQSIDTRERRSCTLRNLRRPGASPRARARRARPAGAGRHSSRSATAAIQSGRDRTSWARRR